MKNAVHRQAKAGGEVGANGEWYKGGQFIATIDRPKGMAGAAAKPRKVQVEPYTWQTVPGDIGSLYAVLAGWYSQYDRATNTFAPYAFHTLTAEAQAMYTQMIDAYNAGYRFFRYSDKEVVG